MAKETYYFSHDYNARTDPKLQKVLMVLGQEGKGVYWDLVEMLYQENGYLNLIDIESYSFALRTSKELIENLIKNFDLFKNDEKKFWSTSILLRLKKRKLKIIKAKKSANARWKKVSNKCERIPNALRTQSDGNAIKESKVKKRKEEEKEEISPSSPKPIGSEMVQSIAREVWEDQIWKNNVCMGNSLKMEDLKIWMARFNASVSNDTIEKFNDSTYKKIFPGWLNKQKSNGVKVNEKILEQTFDHQKI